MSNAKLKFRFPRNKCGYNVIEFKDDNYTKCTMAESPNFKDHILFGANEVSFDPIHGEYFTSWMHLNRKQARQLAEELTFFADNGKLRKKENKK